jgi:hypothetical protein
MMRLLIILLFTTMLATVHGQEKKSYKVNPGEKVSEVLQKKGGLYQYPGFQVAVVQFRNGKFGSGRLNFNRLLAEMQYIDEKGDTVSLADEKEISYIAIAKDTFLFRDGYIMQWKVLPGKTVLAKRTVLELTNRQKLGGFGELTSASVGTTTNMSSNLGLKDMVPQEVLTLTEASHYFIGDRYNRFKQLNKKSLYDQFSKHKKILDEWLQQNPVNFQKEEDMLKLAGFLQTL